MVADHSSCLASPICSSSMLLLSLKDSKCDLQGKDTICDFACAAGGVDAMDWSEMLERMYMRWAADQRYSCAVSDRSVGEEAGIKGVELAIRGRWAYGYLKGGWVHDTDNMAAGRHACIAAFAQMAMVFALTPDHVCC